MPPHHRRAARPRPGGVLRGRACSGSSGRRRWWRGSTSASAGRGPATRRSCGGCATSTASAFEEVPPLLDGGEAVSSSRVRAALGSGDVDRGRRLLGRDVRDRGRGGNGGEAGPHHRLPDGEPRRGEDAGAGERRVRGAGGGRRRDAPGRRGERRPEPDVRRGRPEDRGPPARLQRRPVRQGAGGGLREAAPGHAAVRRVAELVEQLGKDVAAARAVLSGEGERAEQGDHFDPVENGWKAWAKRARGSRGSLFPHTRMSTDVQFGGPRMSRLWAN